MAIWMLFFVFSIIITMDLKTGQTDILGTFLLMTWKYQFLWSFRCQLYGFSSVWTALSILFSLIWFSIARYFLLTKNQIVPRLSMFLYFVGGQIISILVASSPYFLISEYEPSSSQIMCDVDWANRKNLPVAIFTLFIICACFNTLIYVYVKIFLHYRNSVKELQSRSECMWSYLFDMT